MSLTIVLCCFGNWAVPGPKINAFEYNAEPSRACSFPEAWWELQALLQQIKQPKTFCSRGKWEWDLKIEATNNCLKDRAVTILGAVCNEPSEVFNWLTWQGQNSWTEVTNFTLILVRCQPGVWRLHLENNSLWTGTKAEACNGWDCSFPPASGFAVVIVSPPVTEHPKQSTAVSGFYSSRRNLSCPGEFKNRKPIEVRLKKIKLA